MNDSDDNKTMLSGDAPAMPTDSDESYCAACGGSFPFTVDVCPKDGARLTKLKAQPDALLGRVFDSRFEVRTALGQGGMGTVYRGWQITVDREIAIKVIHPKLASDRVAVKRFLREARLSSRLNQPNIVNVYDFGQTEDGILFIAMELVRGHTLGRELEAMRPLPLKRITNIALQLCDALDSAHGQGIVHRDLKPNNIIILDDPPGRDLIKVLDFGLAKSLVTDSSSLVTNTNAILGTPLYMPPEQIEGKPSDQRADLYSLGCILYQMVSGRPPFVGDNVNAVLAAHVNDPAPPLPAGVPAALVTTIERMMEKDPAKRMTSSREARELIQSVVESGYASGEVADTTPDIKPPMVETGPIALAVTDPAGARPSTSIPRGQPVSVEKSIDAPPKRSIARIVVPLALLGILGGGGAIVVMNRDDATPKVVAPAIDAALDAAPAIVDIDAPPPTVIVDALPEVIVIDAAVKAEAPKRPRPRTIPKVTPPDAALPPPEPPKPPKQGSGTADIDFIPIDKSKKKP